MKQLLVALMAVAVFAGPSFAAGGEDIYNKKCKMCHDVPNSGKNKVGPDIGPSKMTLEQFTSQINLGSEFPGRSGDRLPGFEKKKMPKVAGLSPDDIKAIFDYVHAKK